MAGKKNEKQGRNSPSRQRMIASGRTQKHKAVRMARKIRRLDRLTEKYEEAGGSPRLKRRRAKRQQKIKEVIATFKPKATT